MVCSRFWYAESLTVLKEYIVVPPDFEGEPEDDEPNLGAYEVLDPGGGGVGGMVQRKVEAASLPADMCVYIRVYAL